ncbi:MAG: MFS transporter [Dehalococcoidales bacterium]|jgi:EmrB/QacA subfamily drug resistance transporter|nr:MFS transporter [Dehalococcoidales bacterium]|tara:strand:+ start:103 stop:1464 length:1362 start_codon:yes stop_codon:yes gene_type:complete
MNNKNVVLLIATLSAFLAPFIGSSINIALPSIGREFAMDAILLSWVPTAYLLAIAVFLIPFGRIADIHGRKKIFTYGILIYTIATILSAISTSATMLIAFRILHGIGGAMIFGTGVAILTSVFPVGERGKALGITVAAVYIGLSLGPVLGGLLTQHFGWRSIFWASVPLSLIIIAAIFWKLKGEWAEAKGEKFDLIGSIIYSLALIALIYGLSLLPEIAGIWTILIGILGILAFIWWEKKTKSPVLNIKLFEDNAVFTFSNLAALISYSATFAVAFLLSLYLQYTKGLSPQNAGLILLSMPVVQAIFSPLAGRLSDRIEPRILASVGMGLTTIGLVLFTFLDQNTAIVFILVSLVIIGFGFALFSSPNMNAIMSSVEKRFYGVASATLATMRSIGMMLSMGIAMVIFAVFIGRVEITPEYYPVFVRSLKVAFVIFAALCFGGIFASLARGKTR